MRLLIYCHDIFKECFDKLSAMAVYWREISLAFTVGSRSTARGVVGKMGLAARALGGRQGEAGRFRVFSTAEKPNGMVGSCIDTAIECAVKPRRCWVGNCAPIWRRPGHGC